MNAKEPTLLSCGWIVIGTYDVMMYHISCCIDYSNVLFRFSTERERISTLKSSIAVCI
jgi:hypothetical protein